MPLDDVEIPEGVDQEGEGGEGPLGDMREAEVPMEPKDGQVCRVSDVTMCSDMLCCMHIHSDILQI